MHISGKNNTVADLLSQKKDFEGGVNPSPSITILPEQLFACKIYQSTKTYLEDNPETWHKILYDIHNTPIWGHPDIANTWDLVRQWYEGPRLRQFVEEYIKGCAKC